MKIENGKSLKAFLSSVFEESYQNLRSNRSVVSEDQLNVKGGSDEEALKDGEINSKIIIDKLNTIRAGKSFKDSVVNSQMEKYLASLSKDEKTALFVFTKAIAQIVTGEVNAANVVDPSEPPADLSIKKGNSGGSGSVVISSVSVKPKSTTANSKPDKEEDTSGPAPIKAK
jgi:hypothetical protein